MWHSKNLDILQYEIILGTYFTIYLYISVWLFLLCKMNELQHKNHQQKDLCTQWILRLASAVRMKKIWVLTATHWVHSEDWSDWVDAQADLSLHWAHRSFCWFCHASAQMVSMNTCGEGSTISSFANGDKLYPIILNYALLKHLTCQDCFIWIRLTMTNVNITRSQFLNELNFEEWK